MDRYKELIKRIRAFNSERDWDQYHSPKNLAMALAAEAAEVLELLQWSTEEESRDLSGQRLEALREEIGDVMIYLTMLADKTGTDALEAALTKLEANREKYPVERARGNSDKYTSHKSGDTD